MIDVLRPIAEVHGCSPARIALAWLLAKSAVTSVIVGAKRLNQLQDNIAAVVVVLSDDELRKLDAVSETASGVSWLDARDPRRGPARASGSLGRKGRADVARRPATGKLLTKRIRDDDGRTSNFFLNTQLFEGQSMTGTIKLKSAIDGFEFDALHADPEGARRGGVIVVQEVFGIDAAVERDVARWSSLGFEVLAPSMFDRQERGFLASHDAHGLQVGLKYAGENGDDNPISDVRACIDSLQDNGPVYLVGYCYGGTITWRAAARTHGLSAAASYYGAGVAASADLQPTCPVICHFGAKDPYVPATESEAAVKAAHPDVPVYVYANSGHGFNNEGPDADLEDVRLARERTLALFTSSA